MVVYVIHPRATPSVATVVASHDLKLNTLYIGDSKVPKEEIIIEKYSKRITYILLYSK